MGFGEMAGRPTGSRAERAEAARAERLRRQRLADSVAQHQDGVATWSMLQGAGLTRGQIQGEIDRGAWLRLGRHTLAVSPGGVGSPSGSGSPHSGRRRGAATSSGQGAPVTGGATDTSCWWWALWESGARSFLDGATALQVAGLKGWSEDLIHVTVPNGAKVRPLDGVRHHLLRDPGPVIESGLRRVKPVVAVIRAAQWAGSDRAAATIVAMTVQQRLVASPALLEQWSRVAYSQRRKVLDEVIQDVCRGAHSLNELDFAKACRRRGLPEPSRQVVRTGPRGRVYLDVFWDDLKVHVEIQGAQHLQGLAGVDDALRFNDLGLRDRDLVSLQIPILGLRAMPDRFMDQVEAALGKAQDRLRRAG